MKRNFSRVINNLLISITLILLILSAFIDFSNQIFWRFSIWIILFALLVFLYFRVKSFSYSTQIMIYFMILTAIFGELYLELYYNFEYYDKILHFLNPVFLVFLFYDLLKIYFPKDRKLQIRYAIYLAIALVLVWEIFEIVFDYFFDSALVGVFAKGNISDPNLSGRIEIMSPWLDTLYDILLDFAGIIVGYILIKKSNSKNLR